MNIVKRYKTNKATICANKNCVTVYGETARTINTIVICTVLCIAAVYIAKALKVM
jgi:hypothetical protein